MATTSGSDRAATAGMFKQAIHAGELRPGDGLPSERHLTRGTTVRIPEA
jgi:DNA-binding FadR family transcriptional regulator